MINQSIKPFDFFLKTRVVGKCLCLGGAVPDPNKFSELHSGKEILFWPYRGSGGMLPWKIFKIKDPRLAKMHFQRIQLGKLDKNKSAHSLALKFGCLKNCLLALGRGELPPCPPASYSPEN